MQWTVCLTLKPVWMSLFAWRYHHLTHSMTITNRLKITLTPLRLHSASSVGIPNSINNFRTLILAVRSRPLCLLSASSVSLHGLAHTSIFHNNLRVMLSLLKSPVLRKYSNPFKRPGMYPSISKCNSKRCNCYMHLCTKKPSLHLWMVGNFQSLIILIWTENL